MIRLLHLDKNDEFRAKVATYFGRIGDFKYRGESGKQDPREVIMQEQPHVVLLNFNLEATGGVATLRKIRAQWKPDELKVVVIFDTPPGEALLTQVANSGADYVLLRPVDQVVLEKRIRQLVKGKRLDPHKELSLRQVQEICISYFERMGVPPNFKGYRYLLEGIWLAAVHPEWLNSVTQNLYPAIGQRFGVTGSQVERAMRYAIDVTWEKGNIDQLYQVFPYIRENKGKPTNSVFIAKMVDLVGLETDLSG